MTFETLRLMAQDYANRHKEPSPLPAVVDTMAYAYQRVCQGEDPWTVLGDFSNARYGMTNVHNISATPVKKKSVLRGLSSLQKLPEDKAILIRRKIR